MTARVRPEVLFAALVAMPGCPAPAVCGVLFADAAQDSDGNLSLAVVSPADGELVTSPVTFDIDWGESESDAELRAYVNGREVALTRRSGDPLAWTVEHDSGEIVVELRADSIATEHYGEAFATVRVQWEAPWVVDLEECPELCRPLDNGLTGTIRVLARPRWDAGRLASVTYALDDVELGARTEPPFDLAIDTTGYEDGFYTLTAVAVDDAGNQATATANVRITN